MLDQEKIIKMNKVILVLIITAVLLSGCGGTGNVSKEPVVLKIAVIPVVDTLPLFVAQSEGLFEKNNVKVELVPVASAPERDQLLQAGKVDGVLNETLSVMLFNRDKIQLQVVRYGLMATSESGHFFILASGKSNIVDAAGLKNVEIGISQGTIIEYVTTRLLEANGIADDEIKTIAVPKIPDRMALLASGGIQAAVMPDPLAALAVQQGAKIVLSDSSNPKLGASVISFRKEIIDSNPQEIKNFLSAIEAAVKLINETPEKYGNILNEKKIVPPPLAGKFIIPKFPLKGVPAQEEWDDVMGWAKSRNILTGNVSYQDSVNSSFLP